MTELQDFDGEVKFSGKKPRRSFEGILMYEDLKATIKEQYPNATHREMAMRLKLERNFQKKHLQAYLRGQRRFAFGVDMQNRPMYFNVEENWE